MLRAMFHVCLRAIGNECQHFASSVSTLSPSFEKAGQAEHYSSEFGKMQTFSFNKNVSKKQAAGGVWKNRPFGGAEQAVSACKTGRSGSQYGPSCNMAFLPAVFSPCRPACAALRACTTGSSP